MAKNLFIEAKEKKPFLICAHRGFWGGNINQNSIEATQIAFKSGTDIMEIDVCKTKDGVYYVFHDGNELLMLGMDKPFQEWLSEEVDTTVVRNTVGTSSGKTLVKFADYLEWLPEGHLLNIDRAWDYYGDDDFYEMIERSGKKEQVYLKNNAKRLDEISILNEKASGLFYMPIIQSRSDFEALEQFKALNIIGVELVIREPDSDLLDKDFVEHLKDNNLLIVANAENIGVDNPLYHELNDDKAILEDADENWGVMLENGANVIITDWPNFLNDYRKQRNL